MKASILFAVVVCMAMKKVFRTWKKGWAVRSLDYIPSGAPVCEYIGVLKRTDELDSAQNNDYIFDIDCVQTMEGREGREVMSLKTSSDHLRLLCRQ